MQILVLNGSPRKERGATQAVLTPMIEGMREIGADVELIHVSSLNIKPCRGCFTCWTTTPGKCVQSDEMDSVLPKIDNTDIIVLATPLYVDGMTSQLKMVLDRSIPLLSGKVVIKEGRCRHPRRSESTNGKILLVSVSGFAKLENFDPLVAHVKALANNEDRNYVGAILRPYAWALEHAHRFGVDIDDIIKALKNAGKQLASNGEISTEILAKISREFIPHEMVAELISSQFR